MTAARGRRLRGGRPPGEPRPRGPRPGAAGGRDAADPPRPARATGRSLDGQSLITKPRGIERAWVTPADVARLRGRARRDRRGRPDRPRARAASTRACCRACSCPQIRDAVAASPALRVFVCNVATQVGETTGLDLADHVEALVAHAGPGIVDVVLANNRLRRGRRCRPPSEPVRLTLAAGRRPAPPRSSSTTSSIRSAAQRHDPAGSLRRSSGSYEREGSARRARRAVGRGRPVTGRAAPCTRRRRGERVRPRPGPRPPGRARRDRSVPAVRPAGRGGRPRGRRGPRPATARATAPVARLRVRLGRERGDVGRRPAAGAAGPLRLGRLGRALPARLAPRPVPRPRLAQPRRAAGPTSSSSSPPADAPLLAAPPDRDRAAGLVAASAAAAAS